MEGLAHDDADVFDRVVLIDVDVALSFNGQVEKSVLGQQLEHMIKEADRRVNLPLPATIQRPFDTDVRLLRSALNRGLSGCSSVFLHENLLWADFAWASNPSMC